MRTSRAVKQAATAIADTTPRTGAAMAVVAASLAVIATALVIGVMLYADR